MTVVRVVGRSSPSGSWGLSAWQPLPSSSASQAAFCVSGDQKIMSSETPLEEV